MTRAPTPMPDLTALPGAKYAATVSLLAGIVFVGQLLVTPVVLGLVGGLAVAASAAVATVVLGQAVTRRDSQPATATTGRQHSNGAFHDRAD